MKLYFLGNNIENLSAYSDHELVEIMKQGKPASDRAFTEIYDRYAIRINAYCRTILHTREAAEDVFQDTFIKFYQNVRADYKSGSIVGFLITIARNLCLNYKRNSRPNVPIEDFDFPVYDNNDLEDKELSDLLMMSFELLDHETKEILIMRVFNYLSYNEIAEIVGITSARARYLVFNAKDKLKNILSPYMKDMAK
jgi:RNA polymerase sigma-70 factor (ECF subfamily)